MFNDLRELTLLSALVRVFLALFIGGILGLERGRKNRPAGLRTYMLVCLGATLVMMTNQYVYQTFGTGDLVRMGAQVVSGIGFLGAGTIIITRHNQIKGLTTAAGLWTAACIGLALGIGYYEGAIIGGLAVILVVSFLHGIDNALKMHSSYVDLYLEFDSQMRISNFFEFARENNFYVSRVEMNEFRQSDGHCISVIITVKSLEKRSHQEVVSLLSSAPHLRYIEEITL